MAKASGLNFSDDVVKVALIAGGAYLFYLTYEASKLTQLGGGGLQDASAFIGGGISTGYKDIQRLLGSPEYYRQQAASEWEQFYDDYVGTPAHTVKNYDWSFWN
tara:strand:+ start:214 stop:525 length:312 start_codon:yes stop_codon:yes gene_type:complete